MKEHVGAFIDAVYAIAATILALEIPGELNPQYTPSDIGGLLLDYAISFTILFALWLQHRTINGLIEPYGRLALWLNGAVLLLICLIPRATTFVFEYGGNVTFGEIEESILFSAGWSVAELVDMFYIGTVMAADLALLMLAMMATHGRSDADVINVRQSKLTVSSLIFLVLLLSLVTPFQNRLFLLLIPFTLMFEHHVAALLFRSRRRRQL